MAFPRQSDVDLPLLETIEKLGGSAKPQAIYPVVATYFPGLTEEDLEQRLESYPSTRKWWNLVQWVRQKLVESGEIDGLHKGCMDNNCQGSLSTQWSAHSNRA
jgi:restriction system protein